MFSKQDLCVFFARRVFVIPDSPIFVISQIAFGRPILVKHDLNDPRNASVEECKGDFVRRLLFFSLAFAHLSVCSSVAKYPPKCVGEPPSTNGK